MRSSQWQARILTAALAVALAAAAVVTSARAEPRSDPPKGGVIARQILATWQCQDHLGVTRTPVYYSPWKMNRHSAAFAADQLSRWTIRRTRCQALLNRKKYEWNWQVSVPPQGQRLAQCESGTDWYGEESSRDGTFYSAFNIGRSRYDTAAHRMGVRGWREGPGVPSPWEQWQAARGYYRLYGDGWTGNCHGIMYG